MPPLPMQPTIETLPLLQLSSGDWLSLQVYRFVGAKPGKKVYLQSNLHGAELTGNAVLQQLIAWLSSLEPSQLAGEIVILPLCNPIGTNQRGGHYASGRFSAYDGQNWNRIFWDYEKIAESVGESILAFAQSQLEADRPTIQQAFRQRILAQFAQQHDRLNASYHAPFSDRYRHLIQSLCLDADYVIDLHTSGDQGLTYLFYFRDRQISARLFMLPIGILLDEYEGDAFDEAFIKPWLALEASFAQLGRSLQFDVEAWTLELGSAMQLDAKTVEKGLQAIKNYLIQKGLLRVPASPTPFPSIAAMRLVPYSQVQKYYAPAGGMVQARLPLGSEVQAGQRLYQILSFNKNGQPPTTQDILADRSGLIYDVAINHAVSQGEYVLSLL